MTALPIDPLLPNVAGAFRKSNSVVLEAPPGAGKTTRVPPVLLEFGEVIVLEPRRLAARMAARRVAFERNEPLGATVGYQVRFEEVVSRSTRLRFLTEGVLNRRLLSDPELRGVATVVLDEFHERHLEGDLALALLRRLQQTRRPDLRLLVMSATLNAAPVAAYFGQCPVLRSEGRLFDLDIRYTPHSAAPLEEQVRDAATELVREGLTGDVLVFLPGAAEIRRAARLLEPLTRRAGLLVLPLHGDLPPEEQDRAVQPAAQPKIILSTNVAESSVTIDGVTAVIDSGLARIASDSPWTGLPQLNVGRVSRSSCIQRAGRAGRTAPGRVIRLYSAEDFHRRPEADKAEILRRELSQAALDLAAMRIDPRSLPWFEAPPESAWSAAEELLERLGAFSGDNGRRMARLPVHPRLARLLLEAEARGAGVEGCRFAAQLSGGNEQRVFEQLRRMLRPATSGAHEGLEIAVLAAFPDRVARRRGDRQLLLASGGSAVLASDFHHEWLVAVDIEERREHGMPLVRLASPIEPEWLLDLFPDRVRERAEVEWNRTAERAEQVSALVYDQLVIEESRRVVAAPELVARKAREAGLGRFADLEAIEAFKARVAFAATQDGRIAPLTDADVDAALVELCEAARGFADLEAAARDGGLLRVLESRVNAQRLEQIAPARIRLASGRATRVHYEADKPPWIASRLQDFFGMRETPRVGRGSTPIVVHLLAPNQRPVQMTSDLAGFWERLYPQVRRELCRRYPKHAWPENPLEKAKS